MLLIFKKVFKNIRRHSHELGLVRLPQIKQQKTNHLQAANCTKIKIKFPQYAGIIKRPFLQMGIISAAINGGKCDNRKENRQNVFGDHADIHETTHANMRQIGQQAFKNTHASNTSYSITPKACRRKTPCRSMNRVNGRKASIFSQSKEEV